ncbi:MAG TPA: Holliday junction branch migration protein RuvA [Bacteroidota bacterium]|nr:Holliday junction branch migration protein RuvA [Bacteroidota bacterium]
MIASLSGILRSKSPTEVVVDVNGVGYVLSIPLSTYSKLGEVNTTAHLLTHLHVREDAMQLFGFATDAERQLFKLLISITGIGPKTAQGILSGMSVSDLQERILSGNVNALTAVPGVGRKTAERLVVELRDKVGKPDKTSEMAGTVTDKNADIRNEALLALTSLGYNRVTAEKAIRSALIHAGDATIGVEELIKRALKHSGG